MSILFFDGFDHYTTDDIDLKWTSNVSATIAPTTGRRGGGALSLGAAASANIDFAAAQTVIVGVAHNPSALTALGNIIKFYDGATLQVTIKVDSDGSIKAYRGDTTALLGSSAAGAITTANFRYIEAKVKIHATTGTVDIYVTPTQGDAPILALSLTGQNTQASGNAYCGTVQLYGPVGTTLFDDLYICSHIDPASVSSITSAGGVATATTAADHMLTTGDIATIAGASQAAYNISAFVTVTSATVFTYAVSNNPSSPASGTITWYPDVQNDLLGDQRVDAIYPIADGNYREFVPSSGGSHFALVDDVVAGEHVPDGSDYNTGEGVMDRDSYQYSHIRSVTGTISGVQVNSAALKTSATDPGNIQNLIRTGETDGYSDAVSLTTDASYVRTVQELNPATSAGWTELQVNQAEYGVRVL